MEFAKSAQKNKLFCHDCGKEIEVENGQIKNGFLLKYNDHGKKIEVFKCNQCYEHDKSLRNFRNNEVYSRIVGYLRPVRQWNEGKRKEFEERKTFEQNI